MEDKDERVDEMNEEENFAELLKDSLVKPTRFQPGEKVNARIVKITSELVFLDLGGKSEGYLDRKELLDEEGNLPVKEGDDIQAYFLSSSNNELRFTTQISSAEAGRHFLEDAWQNGIPVEGVVEKEIKGGFEVKIAGGLRGFCPFSQMGLGRSEAPKELIGRHLPFRITQFGEKGRNVVVSNRAVLEEERERRKEALKATLREGDRVKGAVSSIQNFGAFIKIDSIEGLIPISEIGWDRVENVQDRLQVGQEVEVVALKLDWAKDRLSFSLKRAMPDPWTNIEKDFPQGSLQKGTVVRLTNFGAFVELAPGVDGLLHISKLGAQKRISHPREVVSVGDVVEVKIDTLDKANKRISLSRAEAASDEETEEDLTPYVKKSHDSFGTLADLLKGRPSGGKKK
ncbi:MAG: 30S ribosomal protein S1 [Desulfobacteraceae bacterium]|nr:30S ribosomal protein S1 [Desulfobacteraceae bacterium]